MTLEFVIPGEAVAKGRPRFARVHGYVQSYTPKKTKDYEKKVQIEYNKVAHRKKLSGAIKVEIDVIFEPPKSTNKKIKKEMINGEIHHMKKPDADNICKSILDALNGVAYGDDSSIDDIHITKRYGEKSETRVRLSDNKHAINPIIFLNEKGGIIEDS